MMTMIISIMTTIIIMISVCIYIYIYMYMYIYIYIYIAATPDAGQPMNQEERAAEASQHPHLCGAGYHYKSTK